VSATGIGRPGRLHQRVLVRCSSREICWLDADWVYVDQGVRGRLKDARARTAGSVDQVAQLQPGPAIPHEMSTTGI